MVRRNPNLETVTSLKKAVIGNFWAIKPAVFVKNTKITNQDIACSKVALKF